MFKSLKPLMVSGIMGVACIVLAGENYQSKGFSAQFTNSGVIKNLSYEGNPLASTITLIGSYAIPAGMEKHDARFFQAWDYSNKAQFNRKGEKLTVTVDSTMSNKKLKDAVGYKIVCTMEPAKITLSYEVTSKVELLSDYRLFMTHMMMAPELFGRGIRFKSQNGQEGLKVLPETYNAKFKIPDSSELNVSTGKIMFNLTGGEGTAFSYMDCRSWGGKDFVLSANPLGKWTPKPVAHPAGTVWKWNYTITATPE